MAARLTAVWRCLARSTHPVEFRSARSLSSSATPMRRISVGHRVDVRRSFTQSDVNCFSKLSGDDNPIHLDEEYAKKGQFGKPIIHGTLLLGTFSSLLYSDIGGPGCILVSLSSAFKAPAFPDEDLLMSATVSDVRRRIVKLTLQCQAIQRDKVVLEGDAVVLVPMMDEKDL